MDLLGRSEGLLCARWGPAQRVGRRAARRRTEAQARMPKQSMSLPVFLMSESPRPSPIAMTCRAAPGLGPRGAARRGARARIALDRI
jgi:hypothetical protein